MNDLLASLFTSKLAGFYLAVIGSVYLLKKFIFQKKDIIFNCIWLSENGSLPQHALLNLIQLAHKIKQSPYPKYYQIWLWTDIGKFQSKHKRQLRKHGIVLKNYRHVHPTDEKSKQIVAWINQFISMGNEQNKFFYCMAADLLKMYLLLYEFPKRYKNLITIYFDCNDINILYIPPPHIFNQLNSIALHFIYIYYPSVLQKLIGYEIEPQPIWTNDVICVANKAPKQLLDKIWDTYVNNLVELDKLTGGLINQLQATQHAFQRQDANLAIVIVFLISHMGNTIFRVKDYDKTFLFKWNDNKLDISQLNGIQDFNDFIIFTRDNEKGFTWARSSVQTEAPSVLQEQWRKYWYDLFTSRYHEMTNTLDDQIAEANIAFLLMRE